MYPWDNVNPFQPIGYGYLSQLSNSITTSVKKIMHRKRYKELYRLAEEIVSFLESNNVSKDEGCELRSLVEKIWYMEKDKEEK